MEGFGCRCSVSPGTVVCVAEQAKRLWARDSDGAKDAVIALLRPLWTQIRGSLQDESVYATAAAWTVHAAPILEMIGEPTSPLATSPLNYVPPGRAGLAGA